MEKLDAIQEAYAVIASLEDQLNDMTARKVELTRDEAISALGLINALVAAMIRHKLQ